ncbi:MAG: ribose 5-phosphate isomerase B [Actinomycetota bacterium]|nr:ribose 5-phosphate isomerase B [Actinomycetota bacterium]
MRIAIAADHAGFRLKGTLVAHLERNGHEIIDVGTNSEEPVDYPPLCAEVGGLVTGGQVDRGIVIGGSGQGEAIAANKIVGVRAALCHDLTTANLARRHNDANVLALGGRLITVSLASEILDVFLATDFDRGRHERRVDQIAEIERAQPRG